MMACRVSEHASEKIAELTVMVSKPPEPAPAKARAIKIVYMLGARAQANVPAV
jgi:hypothetical protein